MVHRLFLTIFLILCFSANVLADEKILIAAASDLNSAMNAICHAFEKSNPDIKTEVSYGSSGNFFAQIKQGAPYDIFFSADSSYPMRLEEEGLAVKELKRFYAVGRIVLTPLTAVQQKRRFDITVFGTRFKGNSSLVKTFRKQRSSSRLVPLMRALLLCLQQVH